MWSRRKKKEAAAREGVVCGLLCLSVCLLAVAVRKGRETTDLCNFPIWSHIFLQECSPAAVVVVTCYYCVLA